MEEGIQIKQAAIIQEQTILNKYTLVLNDRIESIDQYLEHIYIFKTAGPEDLIVLNVSSPGGSCSVSEVYIDELVQSQATVIAKVGLGVASCASAICLSCDDLILTDMSTLLIHSFSSGSHGTAGEMFTEAAFNKKLNEKWVTKHFGEFLTESEYEDVMKGLDLVFDADQIHERWQNILEMRRGEIVESVDESQPSVLH